QMRMRRGGGRDVEEHLAGAGTVVREGIDAEWLFGCVSDGGANVQWHDESSRCAASRRSPRRERMDRIGGEGKTRGGAACRCPGRPLRCLAPSDVHAPEAQTFL